MKPSIFDKLEGDIHSIKDLEWMAKILAEGYMYGKHLSQKLHTGMEFQQFRQYVQGDDVRAIDWKMYAKTGKFYIRQSPMESEHHFSFILDNSPSMDYEEGDFSKLTIGKLLVATISRICANQGDVFRWQTLDRSVSKGTGLKHWSLSLHRLFDVASTEVKEQISLPHDANQVIIWISDLYYSIDEIKATLKELKSPKSEVIVFHIMGNKEKHLDFPSGVTFEDLENGRNIQLNPGYYRDIYQKRLASHLRQIKDVCTQNGIWYHEHNMQENLKVSIRYFLMHYNFVFST